MPFSILTQGTLLRPDLSLLSEVYETTGVSLALSIAVFDEDLQQSLEPGTPTTAARLATVRKTERGMSCSVFLAPVGPGLTDGAEHLDRALARIKDADATSVLYTPLRLGPDVKEWFLAWLEREHPLLVPRCHELYRQGSTAEGSYRKTLDARMTVLRRRHGLDTPAETPGGARGRGRATAARFSLQRYGPRVASDSPSAAAALATTQAAGSGPNLDPAGQPQLF